MKKLNYINAITTDLMNAYSFIPARNIRGDYVIGEKIRVLEKRDLYTYNVIQVLDGELFSAYSLRNHIDKSLQYSEAVSKRHSGTPDTTVIVVSDYSPEPATYNALKSFTGEIESGVLKVFLVELMTGNINFLGKSLPSGVEGILSERLNSNLEDFETLGDLERPSYIEYPKNKIIEVTDKTAATYGLVAVNVLVFLAGIIIQAVTGRNLPVIYGIKSYIKIISGEYWRFITPIFLHAGIAHLATNSFSLIIFGRTMERIFGTAKFLVIYFAAGIVGNFASFAFTPNDSLGASGAILGLGGALIYLWRRNRTFFGMHRQQYMTLVFMVLFNIVYGFSQVGIDNFAHLGGAVSGFLMAGIVGYGKVREANSKRLIYTAVLAFLIVVCMVLGFTAFAFYRFI